jgi:hypothetical protein
MNVLEQRAHTPAPQITRVYTAWIDASNWATATEAAGVCLPGQVLQQPAKPEKT